MDKKILNELLYSNLLNPQQKECVRELYSNIEYNNVDSIYWKNKYYGTWPNDSVESIEKHVEILQKRIKELKISL